jgi:prophage DNA circulation protein
MGQSRLLYRRLLVLRYNLHGEASPEHDASINDHREFLKTTVKIVANSPHARDTFVASIEELVRELERARSSVESVENWIETVALPRLNDLSDALKNDDV